MPYSVISALMIITTVLLSACSQSAEVAVLEDKSTLYFGRGPTPVMTAMAVPTETITSTDIYAPQLVTAASQPAAIAPATAATPFGAPTPAPQQPVMASNTTSGWQWPVDGKVTADFGKQREGVTNQGITISAVQDAPIHAAKAGEVAFVGDQVREYGNMVILRHANGEMSSYAHADRIIVAKGMTVQQGDTIGYVGQTGRAKAPQLHFAIREGDHAIDPISKLPQHFASVQ
jgi:murein DD-endopeptidase MepM/ murein hydrolase activator NlpD